MHNGTVNVILARANFLLSVSDAALANKTVGKGERGKNPERQTETETVDRHTDTKTDRNSVRQKQTNKYKQKE